MYNTTQKPDTNDPQQGLPLPIHAAQTKIANPLKLSAVFLEAADIDSFLEMQSVVRQSLAKEYHLKERDAEDLKAHLKAGHHIIGVKTESGQLVAQCILAFANKPDLKNLDGYPITEQEKSHTAVIQSVCVDPAFQGLKLSQILLGKAREAAILYSCTQLVSAVADDNAVSICAFKKAGYARYETGKDPVKGYDKTYFRSSVFRCDAT